MPAHTRPVLPESFPSLECKAAHSFECAARPFIEMCSWEQQCVQLPLLDYNETAVVSRSIFDMYFLTLYTFSKATQSTLLMFSTFTHAAPVLCGGGLRVPLDPLSE